MNILTFLSHDWPLTKRQVAAAAGVPTRDVESLVQQARLDGAAIVSNGDGYRLARDADEVARCAAALRRRAVRQLLTARALRRTAARIAVREAEPLAFRWEAAGRFASEEDQLP